jgi:hypothetical protein
MLDVVRLVLKKFESNSECVSFLGDLVSKAATSDLT